MLAISLPLYPAQYLVGRKCSVTIVNENNYCLRDLYSLPYSQSFYLLVFSFAGIPHFSSPLVPSVLPTPHKLSLPPTRTVAVANLGSPLAESQNSSQRELSKNSNLSPLFSCIQPLSGFLFTFNQNHLLLPGLPDPVWSGPGHCFGLKDTTLFPPSLSSSHSGSFFQFTPQDSCMYMLLPLLRILFFHVLLPPNQCPPLRISVQRSLPERSLF